jgi:hypothetical protein
MAFSILCLLVWMRCLSQGDAAGGACLRRRGGEVRVRLAGPAAAPAAPAQGRPQLDRKADGAADTETQS